MSEPILLDPLTFGSEQRCFGCGPGNPEGLGLRFYRSGDEVFTHYLPEEGYEGPPEILHGGLQATLADEIGAWTLIGLRGCFGFTTTMNVRFLRPARYGAEIECRGRIVAEEGRIITVKATLSQGGKTLLTGRISYATATREQAEKLLGEKLPQAWLPLCREA